MENEDKRLIDSVEGVEDVYKNDPVISGFKNINDVFKSFKNQESMLGSRIKLPDESNDDEYNKFVSKTRPKAVEDYGIEVKDESGKELLQTLYDNGLTKRQAKAVVDRLKVIGDSEVNNSKAAKERQAQEAFDNLIKIYGDKDKTEAALKDVDKFLEGTVGKKYPEFIDFIRQATVKSGDKEMTLANHPQMAHALKVMAEMVADDNKMIETDASEDKGSLMEQWQGVLGQMNNLRDRDAPEYLKLQKEKARIEALLLDKS